MPRREGLAAAPVTGSVLLTPSLPSEPMKLALIALALKLAQPSLDRSQDKTRQGCGLRERKLEWP